MTAGYSGTPLVEKLGLHAGMRTAALAAPPHYRRLLGRPLRELRISSRLSEDMDLVHAFFTSEARLRGRFPALRRSLAPNGKLWISWPKKTSKIESNVSEQLVRKLGLANGLVDVKVCAVDEDWSALKFVKRLKDRRSE